MEQEMSQVESALRSQREVWRRICEYVATVSNRELPYEQPKRIVLFGLGSSHFAARLCSYALMRDRSRNRIPVVALSSMGVGTEVIPAKGDWAFGFTHRGTSQPTSEALMACDRAGAFTVQVCGQGVKPLESAKFVLPTCPVEQVEPHTVSVTGAICAVTTMLMGNKAIEEWDALTSIGSPDLDHCRRRAGEGPTLLLGEWEGEWLAREGALKLMEMARIPVRVFGSEEFHHGPRFSLRPDDRIWHVSTSRDPRQAEIRAVESVRVSSATPLAWVPALVELQWLALAVALNRGVNPDDPIEGNEGLKKYLG